MSEQKIVNIGLFAHVDAGKTSLSEQILFETGKIRSAGKVDKGNTVTDNLEIEKQRGITVSASIFSVEHNNVKLNFIDTPGHVDFSSETENAIPAVDMAILIVSAQEGLQAQTYKIVSNLIKTKKPFVVLFNKIDQSTENISFHIENLEKELGVNVVEFQRVTEYEQGGVFVEDVFLQNNVNETFIEKISEYDDLLLEKYIDNQSITKQELAGSFKKSFNKQKLIPVLFSSAKKSVGISNLLDFISQYSENTSVTNDKLSAIVFKNYFDKKQGKWSAVRIFSGKISAKSNIVNVRNGITLKTGLIRNTDLVEQSVIQEFEAGDIAWVQGLKSTLPGDFLGEKPENIILPDIEQAFLQVQVSPENDADIQNLAEALQELNEEIPGLNFSFVKETSELNINIRGLIQKEILQAEIENRYGIKVKFSEPAVIYKETPTKTVEGFVRYWLPKPCWAIMLFKIEPGERNSGVIFESKVSVDKIKQHYQNDVEKAIPTALKQGILGWQVDDVRITLIDGEDHEVHTKSNDFTIATPMGIMDGLQKSEPILLEPVLHFTISAPDEFLGNLISELTKMRAEISQPEIENNICKISGEIPLSEQLDFPVKLQAITGGKAKYITKFSTWKECPVEYGKTRPYSGISPLDTAKYILKARKALQ